MMKISRSDDPRKEPYLQRGAAQRQASKANFLICLALTAVSVLVCFSKVDEAAGQGPWPLPSQQGQPALIPNPLWDAPPAVPQVPQGPLPSSGTGAESLPPPSSAQTAAENVNPSPDPESLLVPGAELGAPPVDYAWYNPIGWFLPRLWDRTLEIGLNGSQGNADALSIRTGVDLSRETELTNWDIDFTYAKNEANGVETQHNALLYSNWDWQLPSPQWSLFNKLGFEYDEFKNFDIRVNFNSGLGYMWVKNDTTQLRSRFGSGASRELGGVVDEWIPEAAFGIDFSHQLTKRQQFSAVVDYFPAWENFGDYRIVSDFGWIVAVDQTDNLSLKINVIDRYDSTPNGRRPNDVDYSVLLIWKL